MMDSFTTSLVPTQTEFHQCLWIGRSLIHSSTKRNILSLDWTSGRHPDTGMLYCSSSFPRALVLSVSVIRQKNNKAIRCQERVAFLTWLIFNTSARCRTPLLPIPLPDRYSVVSPCEWWTSSLIDTDEQGRVSRCWSSMHQQDIPLLCGRSNYSRGPMSSVSVNRSSDDHDIIDLRPPVLSDWFSVHQQDPRDLRRLSHWTPEEVSWVPREFVWIG